LYQLFLRIPSFFRLCRSWSRAQTSGRLSGKKSQVGALAHFHCSVWLVGLAPHLPPHGPFERWLPFPPEPVLLGSISSRFFDRLLLTFWLSALRPEAVGEACFSPPAPPASRPPRFQTSNFLSGPWNSRRPLRLSHPGQLFHFLFPPR